MGQTNEFAASSLIVRQAAWDIINDSAFQGSLERKKLCTINITTAINLID